MKNVFLFALSLGTVASVAQNAIAHCDTIEAAVYKKNNVLQQWEYKVDKKTKKKTFSTLREFDAKGCLSKLIIPNAADKGGYNYNEWEYDEKGNLVNYREGKIDKDSVKTNAFSENYGYNPAGLVTRYRKDIYENEFSQIGTKWEYEYTGSGEKREITYSRLRVKKDTICHDEIKYNGAGAAMERTIHYYMPKGVSDYTKYNSAGLPLDYMRYDKGKVAEHKIYAYLYDAQGQLAEENITDGVNKYSEKKKYDKDKIIYTKTDIKGKVLSTSSLPLAAPRAISFPPIPAVTVPAVIQKKEEPKNLTKKEKNDKANNKTVENYMAQKLVSTDTYNPKGLLMESRPAEGGFFLQYSYKFY